MELTKAPFTKKSEKEAYLRKHGWSTWYSSTYWVNPKVIADPKSQDYTNYGMSLNAAVAWQWNQLGSVKQRFGFAHLNINQHVSEFVNG